MLTPKGRLWSEATIARLAEDRFLLCGPTLAVDRDHDWLCAHLPTDGSVELRQGSAFDGALMVMGPKSRELLSGLTEAALSANAQPWMSAHKMEIAGVPVIALRVSYVGELGWELHVCSADLETHLYDNRRSRRVPGSARLRVLCPERHADREGLSRMGQRLRHGIHAV